MFLSEEQSTKELLEFTQFCVCVGGFYTLLVLELSGQCHFLLHWADIRKPLVLDEC